MQLVARRVQRSTSARDVRVPLLRVERREPCLDVLPVELVDRLSHGQSLACPLAVGHAGASKVAARVELREVGEEAVEPE